MDRKELLENAIKHTCGDRDIEYDSPQINLRNIAALWKSYLIGKYGNCAGLVGFDITAEDVAWLNVLQKISRTFPGKNKADTYEDAAAYAAIAGECSG